MRLRFVSSGARLGGSLLLLGLATCAADSASTDARPEPSARDPLARFETVASRLRARTPFTETAEGFATSEGGRVSLVVPRDAAAPVRVATKRASVRVSELDLAGAPRALRGSIVTPRAHGASYWTADESSAEEWIYVEPGAKGERVVASWRVEGAPLRREGERVIVLGRHGEAAIAIGANEAFLDDGTRITPHLALDHDVLTLLADTDGRAALIDPSWTTLADSMVVRVGHSSTLLDDGRILVVGGGDGEVAFDTVQAYDPKADAWATVAHLNTARQHHGATKLPNGHVLVGGGYSLGGDLDTLEEYDPLADSWTSGANMKIASGPVDSFTMTTLATGDVLIAGGYGPGMPTNAAGLWTPPATWTDLPPLGTARAGHTATLLPSGDVLIFGGFDPQFTTIGAGEIYSVKGKVFGSTPSQPAAGRQQHFAVGLADGRVLTGGGTDGMSTLSTADLYDPSTGKWSPTAGMMLQARTTATATLLPDATVLVVGGFGGVTSNVTATELFDPISQMFSLGPSLAVGRSSHTATFVPSPAEVVVIDGSGDMGFLSSAEALATPGPNGATCGVGADCISTFCADGVCCDSLCGGGGACAACSVKRGAKKDGACTPLDGATCDDGDGCTEKDVCSASVCAGAPLSCKTADPCRYDGACDPKQGVCVNNSKPDGAPCPGGSCFAGGCVGDPASGGAGGGTGSGGASGTGGSTSASTSSGSVSTSGTTTSGTGGSGGNNLQKGSCSTAPGSRSGPLGALQIAFFAALFTFLKRRAVTRSPIGPQ